RAIPSVLRFIFTKNPWALGAILGYGVYKNWDTITEGVSSVASAVSEGVSNICGGEDESSKPAATPTQGNYSTPLENMTITSEFGHRKGRKHEGIDLRALVGTSVRAYTSGVVVQAREMGGYGKQIVIRHDDGKYSRYAHLSE